MDNLVNITDVCSEIFAGGDAPKSNMSATKTDEYKIPIFSNGESDDGLYGYTNFARVTEPSVTVSARGTIGFVAVRNEPFVPIVRLISLTPNPEKIEIRYLYYAIQNYKFDGSGTSIPQLTVPMLKKYAFFLPNKQQQLAIINRLDGICSLISLRKQQLSKLDELVKSRFIELFGDPITNSNNLPTERMELRFNLKAGITTAADDIHEFEEGMYEIPCYGGNGIRGYVREKSYTGNYPIIGRQGALCGNVQYATGEFHATEHAVLVSLLKNDNSVWVYHLLKLMDLFRYHTGAAQPGLAVKTLNTVEVIVADKRKQDQFAAFVEQTDKSKLVIQKSLEKLETLKKALMQQYFG